MRTFDYKKEILSFIPPTDRKPNKDIDFWDILDWKIYSETEDMLFYIYWSKKTKESYYWFYYRHWHFYYIDYISSNSVIFDLIDTMDIKIKPYREIQATWILEERDIEIIKKILLLMR